MLCISIRPVWLMVIHCIELQSLKSVILDEYLPELSSPRWLANFKFNNIVHAKSLTLTDHGLAMGILLPLLQCAPGTKR